MNAFLQEPLQRLAAALHRSIEQSEDVAAALAAIRAEGYQASLLLEVTVALGRDAADADDRQMDFSDVSPDGTAEWIVELGDAPADASHGELADRVAPDDRDYLRSIRIRLD